MSDDEAQRAVALLRSPHTIRERAHELLALGEADALEHWRVVPENFGPLVDFVAAHIRENYPSLEVPYHSRLRHFEAGGVDRVARLNARLEGRTPRERGRAWYDLIIVSVLIDAGAGPTWSYTERATGRTFARSEGLAVASFEAFLDGAFSDDSDDPLRADARRLAQFEPSEVAQVFQVGDDNPMIGLKGRAELLRALGRVVLERPQAFAGTGRPGGLFDVLLEAADDGSLQASHVLGVVLETLADIWPGRIVIGGENLGDVWRHSKVRGPGLSDGLIPFHKLSQWLSYSLLEPLEFEGITLANLNDLTGLAEYRNGGLFIDKGVLAWRDPSDAERAHPTGSELVVEWRALTVALLDRLAGAVAERLELDAAQFPLAKVLQGGTWSAGRVVARQQRPDASPPIDIERDGTVF